ncbi:MAG: site-specific integrase [Planctomycetes bacterium]|nr:site-specific integrase [Planctomycetota bacterium]
MATCLKLPDGRPRNNAMQWRLVFALARFGGLRCPSEMQPLTWGDVYWDQGKLRVRSPKTEHHDGHGERWVPLFPELRVALAAALDESVDAGRGTEAADPVIVICTESGANLRTHFHRIILQAGLTPWPKTFQNLRSTRETELAESYPIHVVTAWLGNSPTVAMKHYLQVTEDHFARAGGAKSAAEETPAPAENHPEPSSPQAGALQKRSISRQPMPLAADACDPTPHFPAENDSSQVLASQCVTEIPPRGFEPLFPD